MALGKASEMKVLAVFEDRLWTTEKCEEVTLRV
jgi:hypothetical protein